MSRFILDDAGRVLEGATGDVLGRVDTLQLRHTEAVHIPRDLGNVPCGRPTLILDLAVLQVLRHARPEETITLWDLHE